MGPPKRVSLKKSFSLFYETHCFSENWPRVVDLISCSPWSEDPELRPPPSAIYATFTNSAFSKCWDVKDGSSTRSGPQHRRMFLFGAYHDQKIPRQKGQDRPYCFARVALQAQIQRLPSSCRKASPRKQNATHGEASQQMVHQRKKEDPSRDHSTGGGDPQKTLRPWDPETLAYSVFLRRGFE